MSGTPAGGRIVATASTVALYPPEKAGVYAATKAAVRTMVEVLTKELGPRRVTVNSLAPGMVKAAGVFLLSGLSGDAAMITGQHLGITGGAVQ